MFKSMRFFSFATNFGTLLITGIVLIVWSTHLLRSYDRIGDAFSLGHFGNLHLFAAIFDNKLRTSPPFKIKAEYFLNIFPC